MGSKTSEAVQSRTDRDLLETTHGNSIATLQVLDSKSKNATSVAFAKIDKCIDVINKLNGRLKKLEGIRQDGWNNLMKVGVLNAMVNECTDIIDECTDLLPTFLPYPV